MTGKKKTRSKKNGKTPVVFVETIEESSNRIIQSNSMSEISTSCVSNDTKSVVENITEKVQIQRTSSGSSGLITDVTDLHLSSGSLNDAAVHTNIIITEPKEASDFPKRVFRNHNIVELSQTGAEKALESNYTIREEVEESISSQRTNSAYQTLDSSNIEIQANSQHLSHVMDERASSSFSDEKLVSQSSNLKESTQSGNFEKISEQISSSNQKLSASTDYKQTQNDTVTSKINTRNKSNWNGKFVREANSNVLNKTFDQNIKSFDELSKEVSSTATSDTRNIATFIDFKTGNPYTTLDGKPLNPNDKHVSNNSSILWTETTYLTKDAAGNIVSSSTKQKEEKGTKDTSPDLNIRDISSTLKLIKQPVSKDHVSETKKTSEAVKQQLSSSKTDKISQQRNISETKSSILSEVKSISSNTVHTMFMDSITGKIYTTTNNKPCQPSDRRITTNVPRAWAETTYTMLDAFGNVISETVEKNESSTTDEKYLENLLLDSTNKSKKDSKTQIFKTDTVFDESGHLIDRGSKFVDPKTGEEAIVGFTQTTYITTDGAGNIISEVVEYSDNRNSSLNQNTSEETVQHKETILTNSESSSYMDSKHVESITETTDHKFDKVDSKSKVAVVDDLGRSRRMRDTVLEVNDDFLKKEREQNILNNTYTVQESTLDTSTKAEMISSKLSMQTQNTSNQETSSDVVVKDKKELGENIVLHQTFDATVNSNNSEVTSSFTNVNVDKFSSNETKIFDEFKGVHSEEFGNVSTAVNIKQFVSILFISYTLNLIFVKY